MPITWRSVPAAADRVQMVLPSSAESRTSAAPAGLFSTASGSKSRNCSRPPISSVPCFSSPRKSPASASRVRSHTCEPSRPSIRASRSFSPLPGPKHRDILAVEHLRRERVVRAHGGPTQPGRTTRGGRCPRRSRRGLVRSHRASSRPGSGDRWRRTSSAWCRPARSSRGFRVSSSSIVKSGLSRVRTPMPCANAVDPGPLLVVVADRAQHLAERGRRRLQSRDQRVAVMVGLLAPLLGVQEGRARLRGREAGDLLAALVACPRVGNGCRGHEHEAHPPDQPRPPVHASQRRATTHRAHGESCFAGRIFQPRRRRISSLIAGTISCMSPTTA